MFKRTQLFLVITLVSTLLLAACTPPQPDSPEMDLSNSDNFSLESETNVSDQTNPVQNNERPPEPENIMKILEDFQPIKATQAVLSTSKGEIVIELFTEQAPLTTTNFLNLINDGFYDGMVIHRVVPDFVVQFGDPLTKEPGNEALWGSGGPGYVIKDEFNQALRHDSEGILSMANRGPDTGGSQVFITLDQTPWLDDKHAVFGRISKGMDVVKQLEQGDTITKATYN